MSSDGNSDNSGTISPANNLSTSSSSVYVPNLSGNPSLSPQLLPLFRPFKTCVGVWSQAQSLYTNDVSQFYNVVDNLVNLKKDGIDMETFLSKAQSLIAEFGTLMPIGGTPTEQLTQREKFFVILLLTKLGPEFESIRNQVLGSNIVPGTTELFKRLLQVTSIPGTHTSTTEQSALVTQGGRRRTNNRGGQKNTRVCDYCNRTGHTRDQCWKLHGRPVRTQASDRYVRKQVLLNLNLGNQILEPFPLLSMKSLFDLKPLPKLLV
ncbi:PREDICTED: uncharacterized protein LOC109174440 [Ipomoea nil]|uniref:uncharacterized protein LOC109174440 n=1 Tax=Ipomoea nil TaxID=35883 RepID=UPI000900FDDA|nr:PREDICTED: uncharacterized protein LOC109174440 [Ipomoea nil]